ncbi:MAG TPA: YfiR family protein [Cyclobacteriaceae bacterium]
MSIIRMAPYRYIFTFLLLTGIVVLSPAQLSAPSQEYQVKAVFLFNFAQFVEWSPRAFPETETPLIIGVLGEDPFGSYLDETVHGEKINNHALIVQRYKKVEDVKNCQILFINYKKKDQIKQVLENLKEKDVLTVGDATNFAQMGGVIGFFTEEGKIRIRVNLEVAKNSELSISSKLLRVAEIVKAGSNN